jgi:uncharacterized repeat protein (TIGR04138 family)
MEGTQYFNAWFVCDSCAAILLEPSRKLQKLAEKYGTVTRIPTPKEIIQKIVEGDSRFSAEAYEFVAEAMKAALLEWHSKRNAKPEGFLSETRKDIEVPAGKYVKMEISSKQLVVALQRLASERFGKCATATFNSWGVTCWQDFAEVVSRMREAKVSLFSILAFNREDFKGRGVLDDVFPER